jgi:hypothetical protein
MLLSQSQSSGQTRRWGGLKNNKPMLPKVAANLSGLLPKLRIPIQSGRVFRLEAGHRSGVKPATIPR